MKPKKLSFYEFFAAGRVAIDPTRCRWQAALPQSFGSRMSNLAY